MTLGTGDGRGQDGNDELVEFGADRARHPRWVTAALLAGLVVATAVTVAVRTAGQDARPAAKAPPPPSIRVTTVRHPLLGVTAGWELFARGSDDLLRIQLAQGRITQTYVPPLESASPDVEFVITAHEAVIRSADLVPGYVVPDGGQARPLTGLLAGGGPMVPGPAGTQAAWVTTGGPASPALSLVSLTGRRSGPSIRFQPGGPQLPETAVSDGRGGVLVTSGGFDVYDAGPGWDWMLPGAVIAVGPASWLDDVCNGLYRHCRYEVIDTASGSRRFLPGPGIGPAEASYFAWPPTGVIAPDGSTAAVALRDRDGELIVRLIDLRTGTVTNLGVPVGMPGVGPEESGSPSIPLGVTAQESMAWSPDSRWLFIASTSGRLVAVSARTGRVESLGIALPAVDQVAIRP